MFNHPSLFSVVLIVHIYTCDDKKPNEIIKENLITREIVIIPVLPWENAKIKADELNHAEFIACLKKEDPHFIMDRFLKESIHNKKL